MNLLRIVFFVFVISFSAQSQQVKIFDYETNYPIENVSISNESNQLMVYSDENGIADLSEFEEIDVLTFSHLSYFEYELLKRDIKQIDFIVHLYKKSEQLNEIVLSVSKGDEKKNRVAEQIQITTAREIMKSSTQTSADLLSKIPGIKVQKSQFGGGSPVIRGMEANRVLLVVDGVRMNNAIYRTGHLQNSITISPNILERTEVIFGPSSVIYGSDALGGVIHYYTKIPKTNSIAGTNTSVFARYSSVNDEFTTQGSFEVNNKKWASFTSISNSVFGDLKMGQNRQNGFDNWGKVYEYSNNSYVFYNSSSIINTNPNLQKNTGYKQIDFLQKFAIPFSKNTNFILNFQYSKSSDIPRFDKLTQYSDDGYLTFAEWYYGPQKRLLISPQLKINPKKKLLDYGIITLAFQDIKESRIQRKFTSLDRMYRDENVKVYSINGDFFVPLTKNKNRILSYGLEVTHNKVSSNAIGKTLDVSDNKIVGFTDEFTIQSRYPDGGSSYSSFAIYTNYRQDISSKSTLNTGIRFINTYLSAKWDDDTFITLHDSDISLNNSSVTATIGYIFKPSKKWQLNTVISSGFRSPNIDDVGKIREKSGKVTVPNINLRPEHAYNFETSVLKYFNNKKFQVGLNLYYTLLNNYITRDYFSLDNSETIEYDGDEAITMANVNKKSAYIYGGTFNIKGRFNENWYSKGSITYTKGETYDTKIPLSSIPPLFGSFEIGYRKERFETGFTWIFNGRKLLSDYNLIEGIDNIEQTPFNTQTSSYFGTPRWNIFNLDANYSISNKIQLFVNIDNIFDIHYKEFASAISSPGRNFSFALNFTI